MSNVSGRTDAEFTLIDLADHPLPFLDERIPPSLGRYEHDHTKAWAATIAPFDGFIIVTPEYNHSVSAALKNALDYLYAEWNDKAVGIVSYGSTGGTRAAEALRLIAGELQMADVRGQVCLPFASEFDSDYRFAATPAAAKVLDAMVDQLVAWSAALASVRQNRERA
jgi:NAD(P)H-dependent FMN reductase